MEKKIKVIADTREKSQGILKFDAYENIEVHVDTLNAGDYTLFGRDLPNDDDSIIIERKKDCQELITNIGAKWEQFEIEMEKLTKYKHKQIVVCGPDNFEYLYSRNFTKLHPNFVYKRLAEIYIKYNVPVIFAGCRESAENYIYRLFKEIERRNV